MRKTKLTLPCLCVAMLAGCDMAPHSVTRIEQAPLTFYAHHDPAEELIAQASALRDLADDLVRRSTWRGALSGAAVGCGVTLVSGANAEQCATAAIAAGAIGATIGHRAGKKEVEKHISQADISRSLHGLRGQTDRVTASLPTYLTAQNTEIARLKDALQSGEISMRAYDTALEDIRLERAALALALDESAAQMGRAKTNLDSVSARAETDLHDEIVIAEQLEQDIASARSAISLF